MCTYHSTWFSRSKGTCTSNGGWFSQSCQVYRAWAWVTSWTLTKIAKWRRLAFERSYVIAIVHYVLTSFFVTYFIAPHYSRGWTFLTFLLCIQADMLKQILNDVTPLNQSNRTLQKEIKSRAQESHPTNFKFVLPLHWDVRWDSYIV